MVDYVIVNLTGIYDAENIQTLRMLVACLDYGLVIACVLAHGLKEVPDERIVFQGGIGGHDLTACGEMDSRNFREVDVETRLC